MMPSPEDAIKVVPGHLGDGQLRSYSRVSQRKLSKYVRARKKLPLLARFYLGICNALNVHPDTLQSMPSGDNVRSLDGMCVPAQASPVVPPVFVCPSLSGHVGCFCPSRGGRLACAQLNEWVAANFCFSSGRDIVPLRSRNVGTFRISDFDGSPQQHAILNRHLMDYFADRRRSQETTRYSIPASQVHLLADLGMEPPQPDAPVVPHGLHKSIEEGQLWRMRNYLAPDAYNLICVKDTKRSLLPPTSSCQNPVRDAKDSSRFPGWAIKDADLSVSKTHFMHDVSSEVTPHELVEKLVAENPEAHLFVTGMNPAEVLDRVATFEPSSHHIQYEGSNFNYVFTGSASEAYSTPVDVTLAWLNSSSIHASNGRVYQVVLLEEKLGHCLYHIYCGDVRAQDTRTYSTGSMVRLPASVTGTFRTECLPAKLLTATLDFVRRTPDLSTRNLSAKITQVSNVVNPRTTARERWIMWYIASQLAPYKDLSYYLRRALWSALYVLTLQWHMLGPMPDVYSYLDERERYVTIKPTEGGGWSRRVNYSSPLCSIPNNPTVLQRVSAFTAATFVYLWPKLALGEAFSMVFLHVDLWRGFSHALRWLDIRPLRLLLTGAIVLSAAVVPGHVLHYFSNLSSHFWRQLWWPGYVKYMVQWLIVELSGAPGSTTACTPGRGWAWQALIWAVALHSVVPGLVPALVVPWIAYTHGWSLLMSIWLSCVVAENAIAACKGPLFIVPDVWWRPRHLRTFAAIRTVCQSFGQQSAVPSPVLRPVYRWRPSPSPTLRMRRFRERTFVCDYGPATKHLPFVPLVNWALSVIMGSALRPTSTVNVGQVLFADVLDCLRFSWYCIAHSLNHCHRFAFSCQHRLGNCTRVPTLTALPKLTQPTVRRRNVDRVLPTAVVQPVVPVPPVGVQLAIPPAGLSFPDWLTQVERAYNANPRAQPPLTPGQHCFWDCVASVGGTPHMWFSWFMAFMQRRVPVGQGVVGGCTIMDMHMFACVSGIGVSITGVVNEVTYSSPDRPTLNIVLSHVPMSQDLHAEISAQPAATGRVQTLAIVLRTIMRSYPAWHRDILAAFQNAPVDSVPSPTAALAAIVGVKEVPLTMTEIADAIQATPLVAAFTAARPNGFELSNAQPTDLLYTYDSPVPMRRVALTTPAKAYEGFRKKSRAAEWAHSRKQAVGATSRQSHDNANRNNQTPAAPAWVTLMNELRAKVSDYMGYVLPAVPLTEEVISFTADVDRADRLISDLKANPSVLGGKADTRWLQSLASIIDLYKLEGRTVTVPVRAYLGCTGSGKTTATMAYLNSLTPEVRSLVRVVSHTESLRAQSKLALDFPEMRGVNFPTIPGLLCEPTAGPVVFDDAGKFYGGILDLVLLTNPMVTEVVVNGDPTQALTKFPVGGTQSEFDKGPLVVAEHSTKYATISHRLFQLLAGAFGLHTTSTTRGHLTHTVGPKYGLPVTTASPRYVQVLASAGRRAYTHDTIQGEDFPCDVEVDMSALEEAVSDRSAFVALTRSKTGVYLHMNAADPRSTIKAPPTGSDLLNALLYTMRSDNSPTLLAGNDLTRATYYAHLHSCMPHLSWFSNVGATVDIGHYQSVTAACNDHAVVEGVPDSTGPVDHAPSSSTHVEHAVHETHWDAKEFREVGRAGLQTDQFKETAFVNPHVHKRSDHATYKLTVEKRITNATPAANYARMRRCPRTDMIEEFRRLVPQPPKWTPEKHVAYLDRARTEYESGRTEAAVMSKLAAHDPERTGCDVVNSLKAQVINKEEKRTKFEAIPGQLIYEYDIAQTLEDAAYALFLEDELFPAFPENFLFYRRMNPEQFKLAYQARWRVGNGVHTSDVTRWDVGCDAGVLNFDAYVFRAVEFPEPYVLSYIDRRLRTRSQHGTLQTGQPSGDRFTWTMNSIRRGVVASKVLCVQPEDTVAINGDDEAMDRCANALPFPDTVWEFKDQNGVTGEFSGFELGGPVPVYSARGIHYRTMILLSRDPSAVEKWVNYLGLLQHVDPDAWEALDVARLAYEHMPPAAFAQALPRPYHVHFPDVSFP